MKVRGAEIRPSHYDNEFQYMTTNPWLIHSFSACVRNNFHMFSPNLLCVCVKGAVQAPITCRLVKMRQHSVAVIKQKDLELLKKPALKPAGGHRAAGCVEKQK